MGVSGQRHAPAALPPGKTRYPLYRRLSGHQGQCVRVLRISPPTGVRSPNCPIRSKSLYRLSYLGLQTKFYIYIYVRMYAQELEGTRRRGRPRKRWKEEVEKDLQVLGVRRRRKLVADRKKWKDTVRQAKAHSGL